MIGSSYGLHILHQGGKTVKTKSQKVRELIPTCVGFKNNRREGAFLPLVVMKRVKKKDYFSGIFQDFLPKIYNKKYFKEHLLLTASIKANIK